MEHHKADAQQLQSHAQLINSLRTQEGLGQEEQDLLDEILNKWERCNELSDDRKEALSTAFNHILDFEKALADVGNFMDTVEAQLIENDGVPLSSIDVVEDMMGKHRVCFYTFLTFMGVWGSCELELSGIFKKSIITLNCILSD